MPDNFYYEVQKRLRAKGLSFKDLEKPTGVTKGRISHILNGHVTIATRRTYIPRIAEFLGIPEELWPEDLKEDKALAEVHNSTSA